jgi:hypothetical protein
MKTLSLSIIALLFSVTFFSCAKEEELANAKSQASLELGIMPLANDNMLLSVAQCPDCVADFNAASSTATTNAVYTLNDATGALTASGNVLTTVASTAQTYNAGNVVVTVSHDATNIYFTLERNNTTGGFGSFRFYSPAVIPVPTSGPGNTGVATGTKKIQVVRPRASLTACSEVSFSFSVGGGGNATVAGSVATSAALSYVLRALCPPSCNIEVGDYRTQTRGYWRNNNGKSFLNAHQTLFPFVIGCAGNQQSFATTESVETYLESGMANGTPALLPQPGSFGAQVLTLLINVTADKEVADFGAANGNLSDLKINIDDADILAHPEWNDLADWNGKTVGEILALAQDVLGGCSHAYTPSQINEIVTAINENYDDGTIDNGLLTCGNK